MKKIIALGLTLLMVMSVVVLPTSAAEPETSPLLQSAPVEKSVVIYEENFDGKTFDQLGWKKNDGADATFAIENGRLFVTSAGDANYTILPDSHALDQVMTGDWTLEYEIELCTASKNNRYAGISFFHTGDFYLTANKTYSVTYLPRVNGSMSVNYAQAASWKPVGGEVITRSANANSGATAGNNVLYWMTNGAANAKDVNSTNVADMVMLNRKIDVRVEAVNGTMIDVFYNGVFVGGTNEYTSYDMAAFRARRDDNVFSMLALTHSAGTLTYYLDNIKLTANNVEWTEPTGYRWMTVYSENFDNTTLAALGYTQNTTTGTVNMSIKDSKLYIDTSTDGTANFTILPDSAELDAIVSGDYVVEFDLEMIEKGNTIGTVAYDSYIALITNYKDEFNQNRVMLRAGGYMDNRALIGVTDTATTGTHWGSNVSGEQASWTNPATNATVTRSHPGNRLTTATDTTNVGNTLMTWVWNALDVPDAKTLDRATANSSNNKTRPLVDHKLTVRQVVTGGKNVDIFVNGVFVGGTTATSADTYATNVGTAGNINSAIGLRTSGVSAYIDNIKVMTLVDAVATIGNTLYYSIEDAVAAANGDTITLLKSASLDAAGALTVSGKDVILDLNGNTLTVNAHGQTIKNGANLTIKNGTIDISNAPAQAEGKFDIGNSGSAVKSTLTLDNVDFIGTNWASSSGAFRVYNSSELYITNGSTVTLTNNTFDYYGMVYADPASDTLAAGKVVVDASTIALTDNGRGFVYGDVVIRNGSTVTMTKTASGKFISGFHNNNITIDNSTVTLTDMTEGGFSFGTEHTDWVYNTTISNNSIVTCNGCNTHFGGTDDSPVNVDDSSVLSFVGTNVTDTDLDTLFPNGWVKVDGTYYAPNFKAVIRMTPVSDTIVGAGQVTLQLSANTNDILNDIVVTCNIPGVVITGTGATRVATLPNNQNSYVFTATLPASMAEKYNNPTAQCTVNVMSAMDQYWMGILMRKYNTTYPVTAVAGEGGTITNVGANLVKYNQAITFEIKANEGYEIADVIVDGVSVGKVDTYTFKKVAEAHTINAVFARSYTNPYTDVAADAWYAKAVEYCTANGLMNGVETTKFAPETALTRGMVVTVLYRNEGEPAATSSVSFFDVSATEYYAKAVDWASANKIVEGMGDGLYAPNAELTLEQLAAIMVRYADLKGVKLTAGKIDGLTVSDWAKDEVALAIDLFAGVGVDITDMTKVAPRAIVAQVLYNYAQLAK